VDSRDLYSRRRWLGMPVLGDVPKCSPQGHPPTSLRACSKAQGKPLPP
jgi:hypothetical protein